MRIWRHLFSTPRRWRANELFLPAGNYAVGRLFPFPDTPFRGLWDAVSWSLIRRLAGVCTTYRVFDFWTALVFPRWEIFLPSMGMFDSQGGNTFLYEDFACANKAWLFNDRGRLLKNKGRLLKRRAFKQKFAFFLWRFRIFNYLCKRYGKTYFRRFLQGKQAY